LGVRKRRDGRGGDGSRSSIGGGGRRVGSGADAKGGVGMGLQHARGVLDGRGGEWPKGHSGEVRGWEKERGQGEKLGRGRELTGNAGGRSYVWKWAGGGV